MKHGLGWGFNGLNSRQIDEVRSKAETFWFKLIFLRLRIAMGRGELGPGRIFDKHHKDFLGLVVV